MHPNPVHYNLPIFFCVYLSFSLLVPCPVGSSLQGPMILLCAHTSSIFRFLAKSKGAKWRADSDHKQEARHHPLFDDSWAGVQRHYNVEDECWCLAGSWSDKQVHAESKTYPWTLTQNSAIDHIIQPQSHRHVANIIGLSQNQ